MTVRIPVSTIQNYWNDGQRVDKTDMDVEQLRNSQTTSAIVNNHFGSGVLPYSQTQTILFDSDDLTSAQAALVSSNDFDGTGLDPHDQPGDTQLGNQIEVELTGTSAFGRLSTKVLIVGLDFEGTPQYDRFIFHKNEKQVSTKHYSQILSIFFNDFKGNNNCSRNLGGRIVIREAASFQLSRDPIMIAQDVEPNLFFRDFKVADPFVTLYNTLQNGIGSTYSVDSLSINTTVKDIRTLEPEDVSSKIGQKFIATTNNIQKITLLLGARKDEEADIADWYDWTGDLVISVYALQTTVSCPTDIVPELAIDFDPNPEPIVQLSYDMPDLEDLGYILTDVPQPVDFVFSGTKLASATSGAVVPGRYYAVTINRSGAANTGTIFAGIGNNTVENSVLTLFDGSWVDVAEDDMWFQVWTDAAKVADGQAYDAGNGIQIEKTEINDLGATVDYALNHLSFSDSGENILNAAVIQAVQEQSLEEQDERTGNPIFSRQRFEPSFSFVTTTALNTLKETSEPLVIGCAQDANPVANPVLDKIQTLPGLVRDDSFIVVNPDADLLSLQLIGSKLIPNLDNAALTYRIFKVLVCTDGYGDVNGDGVIDSSDIVRASALLGESLELTTTQQKIKDGYIDTLELLRADVDGDGYVSSDDVDLITQYVSRDITGFPAGSTFTHLEMVVQRATGRFDGYFDCGDGYMRLDGYIGSNIVPVGSISDTELLYDGYALPPTINGNDEAYTTVPFANVTYRIQPQPFWQDYLVAFSSEARTVPAAFTFDEAVEVADTDPPRLFSCENRADVDLALSPGRNDFMVPDNFIIGKGEILRPDGEYYKIDYEVAHVVLELPAQTVTEGLIDVFTKFVKDVGTGFTAAGYLAPRFGDGTTPQSDALSKNQVRFGVAIQSFMPGIADGYSACFIDQETGILTLSFPAFTDDPIYESKRTKIEISIYLKKGGWNNTPLTVDADQIIGLMSS